MSSVLEASERLGADPTPADQESGSPDWWPVDWEDRCECAHTKYSHEAGRRACFYCTCRVFTLEPTLGL